MPFAPREVLGRIAVGVVQEAVDAFVHLADAVQHVQAEVTGERQNEGSFRSSGRWLKGHRGSPGRDGSPGGHHAPDA